MMFLRLLILGPILAQAACSNNDDSTVPIESNLFRTQTIDLIGYGYKHEKVTRNSDDFITKIEFDRGLNGHINDVFYFDNHQDGVSYGFADYNNNYSQDHALKLTYNSDKRISKIEFDITYDGEYESKWLFDQYGITEKQFLDDSGWWVGYQKYQRDTDNLISGYNYEDLEGNILSTISYQRENNKIISSLSHNIKYDRKYKSYYNDFFQVERNYEISGDQENLISSYEYDGDAYIRRNYENDATVNIIYFNHKNEHYRSDSLDSNNNLYISAKFELTYSDDLIQQKTLTFYNNKGESNHKTVDDYFYDDSGWLKKVDGKIASPDISLFTRFYSREWDFDAHLIINNSEMFNDELVKTSWSNNKSLLNNSIIEEFSYYDNNADGLLDQETSFQLINDERFEKEKTYRNKLLYSQSNSVSIEQTYYSKKTMYVGNWNKTSKITEIDADADGVFEKRSELIGLIDEENSKYSYIETTYANDVIKNIEEFELTVDYENGQQTSIKKYFLSNNTFFSYDKQLKNANGHLIRSLSLVDFDSDKAFDQQTIRTEKDGSGSDNGYDENICLHNFGANSTTITDKEFDSNWQLTSYNEFTESGFNCEFENISL